MNIASFLYGNRESELLTLEVVRFIVDAYRSSTLPFYNDKLSLMACLELDSNLAGMVSESDYKDFLSKVLFNMYQDLMSGKKIHMNDVDNTATQRDIMNKINDIVFSKDTFVVDSSGVNDSNDYVSLPHEFVFRIRPEHYMTSIAYLYEAFRKDGLNNFRIVTPSPRFICAGYNETIKLRCDTASLPDMLNFIHKLPEEFTQNLEDVLPIYLIYEKSKWVGYTQVNSKGKNANVCLFEAIYQAIMTVVQVESEKFSNLTMENGLSLKDYLANAKNKYVAIRKVLDILQERKDLSESIMEATKSQCERLGISLEHIYSFKEINQEIADLIHQTDLAFEQRKNELEKLIMGNDLLEPSDKEQITLPESLELLGEIKNKLEDCMDHLENVQEVWAKLTEYKRAVSQGNTAKKRELENFLLNNKVYPMEMTQLEGNVLSESINRLNEICNQEYEKSNKYIELIDLIKEYNEILWFRFELTFTSNHEKKFSYLVENVSSNMLSSHRETFDGKMGNTGINVLSDEEKEHYKKIYAAYVPNEEYLDVIVGHTNYTVLDYFICYDLQSRFKPDSIIVLKESGKEITVVQFMGELASYLAYNGFDTFDDIYSYYVSELKDNKEVSL